MAWKIPYVVPRAGDVVDAIELDNMFRPFVEEFSRFNAQNISSTIKSSINGEYLALDAAYRAVEVSVSEGDGVTYGTYDLLSVMCQDWDFQSETNAHKIPYNGAWVQVEGLTRTFVTTGAYMMAVANMQYKWDSWTGSDALESGARDSPNLQVAIRVDGSILLEYGAGDFDTTDGGEMMQQGYGGIYGPAEVEATFPLSPGTHTVDVVVRLTTPGGPILATNNRTVMLYSRLLALVEMR